MEGPRAEPGKWSADKATSTPALACSAKRLDAEYYIPLWAPYPTGSADRDGAHVNGQGGGVVLRAVAPGRA